jgi:hypothetical protein
VRDLLKRLIDWLTGEADRRAWQAHLQMVTQSHTLHLTKIFKLQSEQLALLQKEQATAIDETRTAYRDALLAIRDSVLVQQSTLQGQQQMLTQFLSAFSVDGSSGGPRVMDETTQAAIEMQRMEEAGFPVHGTELEKLAFMARHMEELNG